MAREVYFVLTERSIIQFAFWLALPYIRDEQPE